MSSARPLTEQNSAAHAVAADFCRIFQQDMDRLYLLSFLLTADETMAEACFVDGLENSAKSPRVFKEWAHAWARRMVIQNAIHMLRPQPDESVVPKRGTDLRIANTVEIRALVELPAFERFVLVMSVLETYSDQECALLLDCTRGEVVSARVRALRQLGSAARDSHPSANTVAEPRSPKVTGLAATFIPRLVPAT